MTSENDVVGLLAIEVNIYPALIDSNEDVGELFGFFPKDEAVLVHDGEGEFVEFKSELVLIERQFFKKIHMAFAFTKNLKKT
jgi:hypothetical protein